MGFYRARFVAAAGAGGTEAATAQIPRRLVCVSVRAGGSDTAPAPVNNEEIELDITFDGTEKLTDNPTVASTIAGDGRQSVYLSRPAPVNNSIAVALTNNGGVALGVYDVVFECIDPEA